MIEQVDVIEHSSRGRRALLDLLDVLYLLDTLGRERARLGWSGCARNLPALYARLADFACSCARAADVVRAVDAAAARSRSRLIGPARLLCVRASAREARAKAQEKVVTHGWPSCVRRLDGACGMNMKCFKSRQRSRRRSWCLSARPPCSRRRVRRPSCSRCGAVRARAQGRIYAPLRWATRATKRACSRVRGVLERRAFTGRCGGRCGGRERAGDRATRTAEIEAARRQVLERRAAASALHRAPTLCAPADPQPARRGARARSQPRLCAGARRRQSAASRRCGGGRATAGSDGEVVGRHTRD